MVVDTTGLNVHELTRRVQETMLAGELRDQLLLTFVSFGYKFGLPLEADMVLDARFLPNPHWVEELRPLTGRDDPVKDYVLARPETHGFLERAAALLQYLLPLYTAEQKTQTARGHRVARGDGIALWRWPKPCRLCSPRRRESPRRCAIATWTAEPEGPGAGVNGRLP